MKNTIDTYYFRNWFLNSQYKNNFSIEGLSSLYDYLVDLEEDQGTELILTPSRLLVLILNLKTFKK